MDPTKFLEQLISEHQVSKEYEKSYSNNLTTGIVVDTDDPLQMGRLRVFCPALNDSPKKLHHLPWAVYVPPFGGVISNPSFARGTGKGPHSTDGATAYGFWGVPEQGAKVIVACIDGDERRRVWLGCMYDHQETHTLFHGRFKWEGDGSVDGPLSSKNSPIQPLYDNMQKAFDGDTSSPEWKTRQAEYQSSAVILDEGDPNSEKPNYGDQQFRHISEAEKDEWVKPILGAHGYDWSGNKAVGSHLAPRVYGFSTPGGHAISMDDRPTNSRIRIRSATGQQIILDDTNERIYVSTNEGANWVEMDSNGNIDIYAKRRVSIHAEKDINFSTDETFRVKAKKGIYMYSGDSEGQESLPNESPEDGEIRFHSTGDTHLMVEKNFRQLVKEDSISEIGKDYRMSVGENMSTQVENEVDFIVNDGDYRLSIDGDYNHHASGNMSLFSGDNTHIQSVNDVELFSYSGSMDIGSQLDLTVKSYEANITVESLNEDVLLIGGDGKSQIMSGDSGVAIFSTKSIKVQTADEYNIQTSPSFGVNSQKQPTLSGTPLSTGCINIPGALNVSFKEKEIDFGIDGDIKLDVGDGIKTSVSNINQKFEQIEDRFNDAVGTLHKAVGELTSFLGSGTPSFPFNLSFTLPTLPSLNFNIAIPQLELPDFNFGFCLNVDPLLQVPSYNPFPDGAFINVGADLGGWTKNSFKRWTNRQKNNFTSSVNSIRFAFDASIASVPATINQMQANVTSIRNSVTNLVNVNITDNGTQLVSYSVGIGNLLEDVRQHNENIRTYNTVNNSNIPTLDELENELTSHSRRLTGLVAVSQDNPTQLDGGDFSELEELIPMWEEFLQGLEDIE